MHAPAVVAAARAVRALEARNRLLTLSGWTIGAALGMAFLIVLAVRLWAGVAWWWVVPAGCAVLVAAGTFAWVRTRRWSLTHAAGEIDRTHATEGAIRTALELTESDGEPVFVAMARSRGQTEAARINPLRVVTPPRYQGWWTALAAAAACVLAGLFVPAVSFGPPAPPAVRPAVLQATTEQVNTARSEIESVDPASLPDPQSWNRAVAELDAIEQELRAGTVGEDAPARTAAALEQAAEELQRQTELAARDEQSLQERAASFEARQEGRAGELSERLADALRRNDLLRAEEVAREIEQAASSMTEEERRALSDALEDLASTLEPPAPPRPTQPDQNQPDATPPGADTPSDAASADPTQPQQPPSTDPARPPSDPTQPTEPPPPTPQDQPTDPQRPPSEQGQQSQQGQQSEQGQQSQQGQQSEQGQQQSQQSEPSQQGPQNEQGPPSQTGQPSEQGQQSQQGEPQPGQSEQPAADPSDQRPGDQSGSESTPDGEGASPRSVPDALRQQARELREPSPQDAQPTPTPGEAPQDQPSEPGSDPESANEPAPQAGDSPDNPQPGATEQTPGDAAPSQTPSQGETPGSLQRALQDLQRRQQAREDNQRLAERLRDRARDLIDPDAPQGPGGPGDRDSAIAERTPEDRPVRFEPVDASGGRADPDAGSRVVGEWFDPDRTELPPSERQAAAGQMRDAARRARDAVDNQQVPRRYRDLVQRVFERVDRRAEEIGSGSVAPQGRDANP